MLWAYDLVVDDIIWRSVCIHNLDVDYDMIVVFSFMSPASTIIFDTSFWFP